MKLRTLLFFLLSSMVPAAAQQMTHFTQFLLNPYLLNPSYAGIDGQPAMSLFYRNQWIGIDDAPTTAALSLHAPLTGRVGGGVTIASESLGFFRRSTVLFSASYHVPLADETWLRFGLSGGGNWNTVDMQKLGNVQDQALAGVLDQSASLAGNAGVSVRHRSLHFGIALPVLFSPSYLSTRSFSVEEVRPFETVTLHASNRVYFNNNNYVFEPFAVYHVRSDLPSQWELGGLLQLNHALWAGMSYRQQYGVSLMGGVKLKNQLAIGASYSIKQSGYEELNSPGFEINLTYLFGKPYRKAPVYSFVNAEKPRQRPANTPVAAAKPTTPAKPTDPSEVTVAEPVGTAESVESTAETEREDVAVHSDPPAVITVEGEDSGDEIEEAPIVKEDVVADADSVEPEVAAEPPARPLPVEEEIAMAEEIAMEVVKRGSHADELQIGHYVTAGAFVTRENAMRFAEGLRHLGFRADAGYSTQHGSWYVYVLRTHDPAYAESERKRLSRNFLLRDVSLLKVE